MTNSKHITKLDNYEDEDIFDVVVKLEKSFGLKFDNHAFFDVKTFGDLCDVFEVNIKHENRDGCTKQQAFYKIRKAISAIQLIDENEITLDSNLTELLPRHNRRKKTKELRNILGTDINILTYPGWLSLTFLIEFLFSIAALFFDWKIAAAGLVLFFLAIKIADRLVKELNLQTVRELTEKLAKENYIEIRRFGETINRREIVPIIVDTFSNDLDIDKTYLTRDAKFSWT